MFPYSLDEAKRARAEKLDGSYLLKTDRHDLTADEAWRIYMLLTRAEAAFRTLKSPLGQRTPASGCLTSGSQRLDHRARQAARKDETGKSIRFYMWTIPRCAAHCARAAAWTRTRVFAASAPFNA